MSKQIFHKNDLVYIAILGGSENPACIIEQSPICITQSFFCSASPFIGPIIDLSAPLMTRHFTLHYSLALLSAKFIVIISILLCLRCIACTLCAYHKCASQGGKGAQPTRVLIVLFSGSFLSEIVKYNILQITKP